MARKRICYAFAFSVSLYVLLGLLHWMPTRDEGMWTDLAAFRYDVAYFEDLEDESAILRPVVGRFKSKVLYDSHCWKDKLWNSLLPVDSEVYRQVFP